MPRKRKKPTEYQTQLRQTRRCASRHVVKYEADLSETDKRHVFADADQERRFGNGLPAVMHKRLEQLFRTRHYRGLLGCYGRLSDKAKPLRALENPSPAQAKRLAELEKRLGSVKAELTDMQKQYKVTWDDCHAEELRLNKFYDVCSVMAHTKAQSVWQGVEKVLFSNGRKLSFAKKGKLPAMQAKQINRCIVLSVEDGKLVFRYRGIRIPLKDYSGDRFLSEEAEAMLQYLTQPEVMDRKAVDAHNAQKPIPDLYRPCYAAFICKTIRGKLRVYVHVAVEGHPKPKKDRFGQPRHMYGKGRVGCDIGTQTIAYTSDSEVGLENLAERGSSIRKNERKERLLYRALDRSRRDSNPDNYDKETGMIVPGPKTWKKSNRYRRRVREHQEASRIAAENRKYAIRERVNHMRVLGDVFITEPANAAKLQKKAKPDPVPAKTNAASVTKTDAAPAGKADAATQANPSGKKKRRKRFGKSIKNRCPGFFQAQVKQRFEQTGGTYVVVPSRYRASQYDHTADAYIPKKLSDRMYHLKDKTLVQRDWYSSFLLYCAQGDYAKIDRKRCLKSFSGQYAKEQAMVDAIARSGKRIINSGIKPLAV